MAEIKLTVNGKTFDCDDKNYHWDEKNSVLSIYKEVGLSFKPVPKKDYEIISFKHNEASESKLILKEHGLYHWNYLSGGNSNPWAYDDILKADFFSVHSVKRLSDGEIFSVGDIDEKFGIIDHFEILKHTKDELDAFCMDGNNTANVPISDLKKWEQKKFLFLTEDLQPYDGTGNIWMVEELLGFAITNVTSDPGKIRLTGSSKELKYFSTEHGATKYVLENKPVTVTFNQFNSDYHDLYQQNPASSPMVLLTTLFDRYTSGQ